MRTMFVALYGFIFDGNRLYSGTFSGLVENEEPALIGLHEPTLVLMPPVPNLTDEPSDTDC